DFQSVTGEGAEATVHGRRVAVGNEKMMERLSASSSDLSAKAQDGRSQGQTVMFVAVDGKPAGLIGVADPIKSTTAQAIKDLHAAGMNVVMLTGDAEATAKAVGNETGIDEIHANVSPEDKHRVISELQADLKSTPLNFS